MVEKAKKNENNRFHRKKEQWLKVESVSKIPKNFNIWGFPPPMVFFKDREARSAFTAKALEPTGAFGKFSR